MEEEWSGEVAVCGAVRSVLKPDQKRFFDGLEHERASERKIAANTVHMKIEHVRQCRALRLHFHRSAQANWKQAGIRKSEFFCQRSDVK